MDDGKRISRQSRGAKKYSKSTCSFLIFNAKKTKKTEQTNNQGSRAPLLFYSFNFVLYFIQKDEIRGIYPT